jgi:regulator of sigma E protease
MSTFLAFMFALMLLVSVHEWGHYRMALAFDVKVLRFSIGLGRPVLRWRQSSPQHSQDTEITIGWLPLGGYVSMLDESQGPVDPAERHRAFNRKSLLARTLIVAAGPVANLVLAILLFAVTAWWGQAEPVAILSTPLAQSAAEKAGFLGGELVTGATLVPPQESHWSELPSTSIASYNDLHVMALEAVRSAQDIVLEVRDPQTPQKSARWVRLILATSQPLSAVDKLSPLVLWGFEGPQAPAKVGRIEPGSPADRGGLQKGDRVLKVNGRDIADAQFLRQTIRQSVDAGSALALVLVVERGGQAMTLDLQPLVVNQAGTLTGRIGAVVGDSPATVWVDHGIVDSLFLGFQKVASLTGLTGQVIYGLLSGQGSMDQLGGPLAIADQAGRSASIGWTAYMGFLGFLSVSLGLLNLLPLPMLDGGHLMYYLWELLTGKPVSSDWMNVLQKMGMVLLLALMATALVNDGMRLWR